jgi:hypothetical protein
MPKRKSPPRRPVATNEAADLPTVDELFARQDELVADLMAPSPLPERVPGAMLAYVVGGGPCPGGHLDVDLEGGDPPEFDEILSSLGKPDLPPESELSRRQRGTTSRAEFAARWVEWHHGVRETRDLYETRVARVSGLSSARPIAAAHRRAATAAGGAQSVAREALEELEELCIRPCCETLEAYAALEAAAIRLASVAEAAERDVDATVAAWEAVPALRRLRVTGQQFIYEVKHARCARDAVGLCVDRQQCLGSRGLVELAKEYLPATDLPDDDRLGRGLEAAATKFATSARRASQS